MRKLVLFLVILVVGAAVLAPVIMMMDLAPTQWDFPLTLGDRTYNIPALYSLCASAALALLYSVVKR